MLTLKTHAEIIDALVLRSNGRIKTQSFHRALSDVLSQDSIAPAYFADVSPTWVRTLYRYIPDAFQFHNRLRVVSLYEVEVSYQTPHEKLRAIGKMALRLIYIDWHVRLVRVDRYGRRTIEDMNELASASVCG